MAYGRSVKRRRDEDEANDADVAEAKAYEFRVVRRLADAGARGFCPAHFFFFADLPWFSRGFHG